MSIKWLDWFYYDETSPSCLRWKVSIVTRTNKVNAIKDSKAGCLNMQGYYVVSLKGRAWRCHRIIYELLNSKIPDGQVVDHIDKNRENNKIENLRVVSRAMNNRNISKRSNNKSGTTGVYFDNKRKYWIAHWNDEHEKSHCKAFSSKKLGNEAAFQLACECRISAIIELNKVGLGYSDDHGSIENPYLYSKIKM